MGTFITQPTTPDLYLTKVTAPGAVIPAGMTAANVVQAQDMNTIEASLLDCRDGIRAQAFNVRHYGAIGDGTTDDTAALQAAATAAGSGGVVYVPAGIYLVSGTVTVTGAIYGEGTLRGANVINVGADNVSIRGLRLEGNTPSGTAADVLVNAVDRSGLLIQGCRLINGRIRMRNTQLAERKGLFLLDCAFSCDFSNFDFIVTQNDVVTVRGINGVWITGNTFDVTNVHRVLKISDTEGQTDANAVSAFRSRNVFLCNNRVTGTTSSAKQVLDLFSGTSDVLVHGNSVEATGWASIIEQKTGITTAWPQNLRITGNRFACDANAVALQGSYGATTPGHDSGYQNAVIADNHIERVGAGTEPLVTVRFFHDFSLTNNGFVTPATMLSHDVVEVLPCRTSCVSGNTVSNGYFRYANATNNHESAPFSATVLAIVCAGNKVDDFQGVIPGGIWVNTLPQASCDAVFTGNHVRQSVDDASAAGGVAVTSSTLKSLTVSGNSASMANAADERLRLTGNTIGLIAEQANSWNVRAGSATYDPPSIAAAAAATTTVTVTGAVLGDFAEASFTRDLQGLQMTAWVSAADTVTVRLQNPTGGAIDLASGTLRARALRYT